MSQQTRDDAKFTLLLDAMHRAGRAEMRAHGNSMRPTIDAGTTLELVPKTPRPQLFDVVCVVWDGATVIHRIIGVGRAAGGEYEVLVAGDQNPGPDGWAPYADIVARVARIDDGAGFRSVPDPARPPGPDDAPAWARWRR